MRLTAVLLCGFLCTFAAWQSRADKADLVTVSAAQQHQDPTLILTIGKAEIVKVDGPVADVMVANPSIVDVQALQSNQLYMVGANIGDTNIIALDAEGNVLRRMNIHVRIDEITLQNSINTLFPGESDVRAKTVNNQVVLTGRVSTPDNSNKIQDLAARITGNAANVANLMTVAGDQQVMLKVRIMEMARTSLRELGTDFEVDYLGGNTEGVMDVNTGSGLTTTPFSVGGFIFDNGIFSPLQGALRMMEDEGLVNILAEPNLSAISGEQAGFLAGGEFPVPTGLDENGNVVVTFRQFGVSLNFRPIVLSNDRISLQIQTEVSSLDRSNSVTVGGVTVPGLDIRRASTTVELGSGGSLMIAGIIQSQAVKGMQGLPGIKDTPILGDLIKSRSFDREESELVVMVTPFMVDAFADKTQAQKLPEPEKSSLAQAFANNIRRTYADKRKLPEELMAEDEKFGYLMP
ncbi:MAG: type II and III secretion system protein family protein [Micavibrio aeruginosavorus]|uniref:Type II and III secretion system protein family protein n=1 Tax=Micavibrio aeruginosavorus TaxID=349221 RepID=A0A7T5R3N7_9BACT|nr:MAG: type II and III secretion system protein family protein [Micavibrio aeruginosavorus]